METRVTLERAIRIACANPMPRAVENVPLEDARQRVLATPLPSLVDDPRFDNSAMDGFAVMSSECGSKGTRLKIIGTSQTGGEKPPAIAPGEACKIMTGAPMPDGADAIVMVEDTQLEGGHVVINGPARPNFIRKRAENLSKGQEALPEGIQLSSATLALAGTMGHGEVPVIRRPRIAILSTGDELVEPGTELKPGQIYESNSHALCSLVEMMGCEATRIAASNDSMAELRRTLDSLSPYDAILTSGGVSMGEWDLVRRIMEEEGEESSPSKGRKTKYPSEIILRIVLIHHQSTFQIIKVREGSLEILFIALRVEKNRSETLKEPIELQLTVILVILLTGSKEKLNGIRLKRK